MVPLQLLRDDPGRFRDGARRKRMEAPVDEVLAVDLQARTVRTDFEAARAEQNAASRSFRGRPSPEQLASLAALKERVQSLEQEASALEQRREGLLLLIPNPPGDIVPEGAGAADSVEVRRWGAEPAAAPPHWEIGERLGVFDWDRAARLSGARFAVLHGDGARLQRALVTFFLDRARARGDIEVAPPLLVRREAMVGTGQFPKFEDDAFSTEDGLVLIPTAEVPVTNLYAGEILEPGSLPIRHAAWTPCFRREAGAAGRDTRGFIRLHQFEKVEVVRLVEPETSAAELERLTADVEALLRELGLHHRVLLLCDGDMGFSQSATYDLEVWSPGTGRWLEVSSCTDFRDFQARRADIRYRPAAGERPRHVHTLNGSALALPRVIAALLECGLQPDGSVLLPEVLWPYMAGTRELVPQS